MKNKLEASEGFAIGQNLLRPVRSRNHRRWAPVLRIDSKEKEGQQPAAQLGDGRDQTDGVTENGKRKEFASLSQDSFEQINELEKSRPTLKGLLQRAAAEVIERGNDGMDGGKEELDPGLMPGTTRRSKSPLTDAEGEDDAKKKLSKATKVAQEILTTEKNFLAIIKLLNEDFREFVLRGNHHQCRRKSILMKERVVKDNITEEELTDILM